MTALYNEIEPYAARWLENLIAAGHIAKGDVDARSIAELRAADLVGRTQCHFFAGIGVWSHALRLAGWPDDREVWTGSCPCQPFSAAGKGGGFDDERHLWPTWFALIRERRPSVVLGEQVASVSVVGSQSKRRGVPAKVQKASPSEGFDTTREATRIEKGDPVRPLEQCRDDSGAHRRWGVRGDGPASESGGRTNMGQSIDRSNRSDGGVSVFEHSNRLPRCERCTGNLGRDEAARAGARDLGEAATCFGCALARARREAGGDDGRAWIDVVRSDLESIGYTVGIAVLSAAGVGAPHIRQRLYFVAHADSSDVGQRIHLSQRKPRREVPDADRDGKAGKLGNASSEGGGWNAGAIPRAEATGEGEGRRDRRVIDEPVDASADRKLGYADIARLEERNRKRRDNGPKLQAAQRAGRAPNLGPGGLMANDAESHGLDGQQSGSGRLMQPETHATAGFWRDADWIACADGVSRPVEPGTFPLAHGAPARVGRLRAYGNAIVAEVAATFIRAAMESMP